MAAFDVDKASSFGVLLRKELANLYGGLTAYALVSVFLLVMGYVFTSILFFQRSVTMVHAFAQAATLMLLFVPLLTMRQFSEERESGALDLLFSTPVSEVEIVFAKFVACLSIVGWVLVFSAVFPLVLSTLGQPDFGPIWSGYLGLLLMSASLIALGLMFAAWIPNPVVAAVVSLGTFLLLWMVEVFAKVSPLPVRDVIEAMSVDIRFSRFLSGAVFASDCAFFLLMTSFGLLLAVRGLSAR